MAGPDPPGLAHPTCLAVALVKADPLQCPVWQQQMRLIAVIDNPPVVEKILRHLNLWCGPAHFAPARPPPSADPPEPDPDFPIDPDPLPDLSRRSPAKGDYEHVITD